MANGARGHEEARRKRAGGKSGAGRRERLAGAIIIASRYWASDYWGRSADEVASAKSSM